MINDPDKLESLRKWVQSSIELRESISKKTQISAEDLFQFGNNEKKLNPNDFNSLQEYFDSQDKKEIKLDLDNLEDVQENASFLDDDDEDDIFFSDEIDE